MEKEQVIPDGRASFRYAIQNNKGKVNRASLDVIKHTQTGLDK